MAQFLSLSIFSFITTDKGLVFSISSIINSVFKFPEPEKALYKAEIITCSISAPLKPFVLSANKFMSKSSGFLFLFLRWILNISFLA